jgi:hypothetical protein
MHPSTEESFPFLSHPPNSHLSLRSKYSNLNSLSHSGITNFGVNTYPPMNLNMDIVRILGLGAKCALAPKPSPTRYTDEISHFIRSLILRNFFKDHNLPSASAMKFYIRNGVWLPSQTPPSWITNLDERLKTKIKNEICQSLSTPPTILSNNDLKKLRDFLSNDDILIQNADKGLGLTVIEKKWYLEQGMKTVSEYELIPREKRNFVFLLLEKSFESILCFFESYKLDQTMAFKYMIASHNLILDLKTGKHDHKIAVLYLMPKLHKTPVKTRPIVAAHSSIYTPVSKLCAEYFTYFYRESRIILPDTPTFIRKIMDIDFKNDYILATADVTNLYGEIPLDKLITTIQRLPIPCDKKLAKDDYIGDATGFASDHHFPFCFAIREVLCHNYVQFNGELYKQTKGVAMGSPIGPTCANLYMHTYVDHHLEKIPGVIAAFRYLDDIFFVMNGKDNALNLQDELNKIDPPHMKFTVEIDENQVSFLDVMVYKEGDELLVRPYAKPANKFLYLPYISFHADNNKLGFIKTELQRLIRNSSKVEDYYSSAKDFVNNLVARGYKRPFIARALGSIQYTDRDRFLEKKEKHIFKKGDPKVFIYRTHLDVDTRNKRLQNLVRETISEISPDPVVFDPKRDRIIFALTKSPSFSSLLINNTGVINPLDRFKKIANKTDKDDKGKEIVVMSSTDLVVHKAPNPSNVPVIQPNGPSNFPVVLRVDEGSKNKELTLIPRITDDSQIAISAPSAPKRARIAVRSLYTKPVPKILQKQPPTQVKIEDTSQYNTYPPRPSSIVIEILPDDEKVMEDVMPQVTYPNSRTTGNGSAEEPIVFLDDEDEPITDTPARQNPVKRKRSIISSAPSEENSNSDSQPEEKKVKSSHNDIPTVSSPVIDSVTSTTIPTIVNNEAPNFDDLPNTIVGDMPHNPLEIRQIEKPNSNLNQHENPTRQRIIHSNILNKQRMITKFARQNFDDSDKYDDEDGQNEWDNPKIYPTHLSRNSLRYDVIEYTERGKVYVYEGPEVEKYFRLNPTSHSGTYTTRDGRTKAFINHPNTDVEEKLISTDYISNHDNLYYGNNNQNRRLLYIRMNGTINWKFKKAEHYVRTANNDIPHIERGKLNWDLINEQNLRKDKKY